MVLADVATHVLVVRLVGASTDLVQLGVSPQSLHLVFSHISISSQQLDGPVGDVLGHGSAIQLHSIRVQSVSETGQIQLSRDVVHICATGHEFGIGLGDGFLTLTELPNGLAESFSLLGITTKTATNNSNVLAMTLNIKIQGKSKHKIHIPAHHFNAASSDSERHGRENYSLDLEVAHHAKAGASLLGH